MIRTGEVCGRCSTPFEVGDLLCSICGSLGEAHGNHSGGEKLRVEVLRCRSCDAATRWSASERAVSCAFCGSLVDRELLEDPSEQTGAYLPFTVERAEAEAALGKWLGTGGIFRPGDLSRTASLESLHPLFWVAWVFDAQALVSWTADSNAGAIRSDWAPHSGQTHMNFDDLVLSASRGLTEDEAYDLAGSYDVTTGTPELGELTEDTQVEAFDVQRSMARRMLLKGIRHHAREEIRNHHIPGSRYRNVHVALQLESLDTRRVALPAWVLAYRYRERLYRVVISGQDAAFVRGKMPVSAIRVAVAVLIAVALVLTVLVIASA